MVWGGFIREWIGSLAQGLKEWVVLCMCAMRVRILCVDCRSRYMYIVLGGYLRCTQCSILLNLMDICFLTCICLWQISQIQTSLCDVVGPGFVSTTPAFIWSSASHPVGPHCRLAQKRFIRSDSSTACRLCGFKPTLKV